MEEATSTDDCSGCKVVINALDKRMQTMSRDELLNSMLQVRNMVSYLSDKWLEDTHKFLLFLPSLMSFHICCHYAKCIQFFEVGGLKVRKDHFGIKKSNVHCLYLHLESAVCPAIILV